MKKRFGLIIISAIIICLFIATGCSNGAKKTEEAKASEGTAQATAEKFLNELYEVKDSNSSTEAMNSIDTITKAHEKFYTVTTKKALESLMADRWYGRNLKFSSANKCSLKATKIDFEKTFEDKKAGKFGFNYTATVEATYDKDQKKEEDTEKGYVGLVFEDNQWKVYSHSINNYAKMLSKTE
ncbi:hypothetical protein CSC2_27580 [Clostridium zeae]|uniref:DUF4829 domain-containing protein n=1 Tax=Clostridium zeae TaxID=2759022 RepID=A0ABQ1EBS4_9CLOT|nr:hypothetical protein [Clostridium zeae]GFZ32232.1 hypothetical protein CSC2_27580 [Clostridium zeae]